MMAAVRKMKGEVMVVIASLIMFTAGSGMASSGSGWHNHVSLYGWLAGIDGTARYPVDSENDVEVEASDVLENINGVFMGNYTGGYDRWSVLVDVIYLNVGNTENISTPLGSASTGLDITSWVVTGAAGYDFVSSEQLVFGVLGGVRYLSAETDVDVGFGGAPPVAISESASITDGIVGVKGQFNINENWFIPYYADIGGGGSDYSYQLFAAIGYRYKWFDVQLGYRHLHFKLDDDEFLTDLQLSGPKIGIGFSF